jgi:phage gp36-like protein
MPLVVNTKIEGDTVYVTYDEAVLTTGSPFPIEGFTIRGLDPTVYEVVNAYAEYGQLVLICSNTLHDAELSTAGIVYKQVSTPVLLGPEPGTALTQHYIPLSTADVQCADGDCFDSATSIMEREQQLPLRIENIQCAPDGTTVVMSFSEYLNPSYVPPVSSFFYRTEDESILNVASIAIEGKDVVITHDPTVTLTQNTIIEYEPPSDNFLRTTENPFRVVIPFSFKLKCLDPNPPEECDPDKVHVNGIGTPYNVRNGECATVDDYVKMFGLQEAIEVSNIGNPQAMDINYERMNFILDETAKMIQGYIDIATWSGQALLMGSFKQGQLTLARYYLFANRRPRDVTEDFTRMVQWIQQTAASNALKPADCAESGRVLIGGISQQYNLENGLGLNGWMQSFPSEDVYRRMNGGFLPEWYKRASSNLGIQDSGNS